MAYLSQYSRLVSEKIGRWTWFLVLPILLVFQVFTLVHSEKPRYPCGPVITLFEVFHLSIMCDSYYYMEDARDLNRLFFYSFSASDYGTVLQDRPLFPILAFVVARIITVFPFPDKQVEFRGADNIAIAYDINIYLAHMLINAVSLSGAVLVIAAVFRGGSLVNVRLNELTLPMIAALLFMSMNSVVLDYFWNPNSGILNILCAAIVSMLVFANKPFTSLARILSLIFAISLLCLLYPLFFVVIPIIMYKLIYMNKYRLSWVPLVALFPTLVWRLVIETKGGTYGLAPAKNFEAFVWVIESVREKTLLSDIGAFMGLFLKSVPLSLYVFIFALGAPAALLIWRSIEGSYIYRLSRILSHPFSVGLLIYFLCLLLIGMNQPRHTLGLFLIILMGSLFTIERFLSASTRTWLLVPVLVAWISNWIWFSSPGFELTEFNPSVRL